MKAGVLRGENQQHQGSAWRRRTFTGQSVTSMYWYIAVFPWLRLSSPSGRSRDRFRCNTQASKIHIFIWANGENGPVGAEAGPEPNWD